MKFRSLLITVILLPFVFGLALVVSGITVSRTDASQVNPPYAGTFTNTTLTQGGAVTMSISFITPDSIKGYMNFTELPGASPLCGAGFYQGHIDGDSLFIDFSSHDTDNSCGFDYGWAFTIRARFYSERDSIAGAYFISNPNSEQGVFNIKRPHASLVAGPAGQSQALIYPNPVSSKLMVSLPAHISAATAIITGQTGQKIAARDLGAGINELNPHLPDGIYFITIIAPGLQSTQQFVVKH